MAVTTNVTLTTADGWKEILTGASFAVIDSDYGREIEIAVAPSAPAVGFVGVTAKNNYFEVVLDPADKIYARLKGLPINVSITLSVTSSMLVGSGSSAPITTTSAALPAGTDRSGTITEGGTAQQLAAANSTRKGLTIQNTSGGDLWVNEIGGTAVTTGGSSYKLSPGAAMQVSTNRAISIIGATTNQSFAATEF